jgi:hypothetical protein
MRNAAGSRSRKNLANVGRVCRLPRLTNFPRLATKYQPAMVEFLFCILEPLVSLFAATYAADNRPEARHITIGCWLIVLAFIAFTVVLILIHR